MCGRFNVTDDPVTIVLLKYFGVYLNIKPRLPLYNMAPNEPVPIILEKSGERIAEFAAWWFSLKLTEKGLAPIGR